MSKSAYNNWLSALRDQLVQGRGFLLERLAEDLGPTQLKVLTSLLTHTPEEAAYIFWGENNRELWHKAVRSLVKRGCIETTPEGITFYGLFCRYELDGEHTPLSEHALRRTGLIPQDNKAVAWLYWAVSGQRITRAEEWALVGKLLKHGSREYICSLVLDRCWLGKVTLQELLPLVVYTSEERQKYQLAVNRGQVEAEEYRQKIEQFKRGEL